MFGNYLFMNLLPYLSAERLFFLVKCNSDQGWFYDWWGPMLSEKGTGVGRIQQWISSAPIPFGSKFPPTVRPASVVESGSPCESALC